MFAARGGLAGGLLRSCGDSVCSTWVGELWPRPSRGLTVGKRDVWAHAQPAFAGRPEGMLPPVGAPIHPCPSGPDSCKLPLANYISQAPLLTDSWLGLGREKAGSHPAIRASSWHLQQWLHLLAAPAPAAHSPALTLGFTALPPPCIPSTRGLPDAANLWVVVWVPVQSSASPAGH